jgi:glycosyltransferase involved in cell wall biosynthesis
VQCDFSIIIPIYNTPNFRFYNCLESLYNSSKICLNKLNFEIIIVNDGSDICYDDIIDKFSKSVNINYHILSENRGRSYARNYGIKNSNSDSILFLDSDDEVYLNYFSEIKHYIKTEYDFITFSYRINSIPVYRLKIPLSSKDISYNQYHYFCTNSILLKKFIFNSIEFDTNLSRAEDITLWKYILKNYNGIHINIILTKYNFDYKGYKNLISSLILTKNLRKLKYVIKFWLLGYLFKSKKITKN